MTHQHASSNISRRSFTKAASATFGAALGFHFIPSRAWGNLEKPALAGIGAGGKGKADIYGSQQSGFQVVALVDIVDATRLRNASGRRFNSMADVRNGFPDAEFFSDYREMLTKMGEKIDAVTVSTPDHHHFHASALAMQAGKHVYCQKPLTHGLWEARMMSKLANQHGVKTQMGNQAHANDNMRRCVELIRAGMIGKVKEVHAWTNRPIWPQGFAAAPDKEPVPDGIDWDQWVGPAPWVDYSSKIAPFSWRGWWNFGTGALGDMACHIMDMPYWALLPGSPTSVTAVQTGATELSPPINSQITWEFGPNQYTANEGFKYHWYDGFVDATFDRESWSLRKASDEYNHPDEEILDGMDFQKFGSVIIGEEGKLFFNRGRGAEWVVKASNAIDGFPWPEQSLPRAARQDNYQEWMDAISGKVEQGQSNFRLAAQLTETVLLGVLAQRVPDTKLVWDADKLQIKGRPDLKKFIQREYRKGWEINV
jgi:predicted dehydrogenase